jgi:hypothetical protein
MTRETLLGLAERCEHATGPDQALDDAIWLAVRAGENSRKAYEEGLKISPREAAFRLDYMSDGFNPTASLDSAMTLVPEGWPVRDLCQWNESWTVALDWPERRYCQVDAEAETAPLALCAAALKARGASL